MTRQEKLYDDYENALFALLMDDVAIAQGQQALAENERLKADPSAVVPGDLHTRCVRTVRRKLAAGRRYTARKTAFRLVSRVAVVLMALMLTLTVAFAASPAMQTSVVSWAVEHYSDRLKPAANSITITSHPQDITAAVGTTARFTVAAVGRDLSYQWQVKTPGGKWLSIEKNDTDAPVFHITAAAADNGKLFRCVITDGEGGVVVSDSAVLTVGTIITRQPVDVCEAPGKTVSFSLEADGPRLSYQWQVRTPGGEWADCLLPGSDTPTLTVDVTPDRAGQQFCCVITDANGSRLVSDTATLTLGIVITRQPADASAAPGEKVTFTVAAEGQDLVYQWQIKTPGGSWADCPLPGNGTPTLTVEAAAEHNGEQYRCVITDAGGSQLTSDAATLTLSVPLTGPIITRQPADATVAIDDTAVFTVAAEGQGLTYLWQVFRDGVWIDTSSEASTLTVKAAVGRTGERYRCVIIDSYSREAISNEVVLTVSHSNEWADNQCGNNLVWTLDNSSQTLTISGTGPMWNMSENHSPWDYISYKNVVVKDGVTSIGDHAFRCEALQSVVLPNSVTSIGDYAFFGDSSLTDIALPSCLERIGESAFAWCSSLTTMDLPDSITSIGPSCFRGSTRLKGLKIPAAMITVGPEAFLGANITSLVIPDNVKTIGEGAFAGCEISTLTIGKNVSSIEAYAFSGCYPLSFLVIPDSVTTIGDFAFLGCGCMSSLKIGSGVKTIGNGAFSNCTSLSSVVIPDQVATVGDDAFYGCSSLRILKIGSGTRTIGNGAFSLCTALVDVTLNDQLQRLSDSVFNECTSLEVITIPSCIKYIGDSAFLNCRSLSSVRFSGSAPIFADNSFEDVTATAYYPAGDSTWTADVKKNYLGHITWVPYNK